MIIYPCEQRSLEWYALRLGKLTGSAANDMLATIKSGEAAARRNLRARLFLERLTGRPIDSSYASPAMQQGIDREPDARALYADCLQQDVREYGFLGHDELMAGCSPDGIVGEFEGVLEIKCPLPATHWESVKNQAIPQQYRAQAQHALWITGAQWCDWVSFNPDFPREMQMVVIRQEAGDHSGYETVVRTFLAEVDHELAMAASLELGS